MRQRFWDLREQRQPLVDALDEKRRVRDASVDTNLPPVQRALDNEIKQLSMELAPIDEEISRLNRALGGRTGTGRDAPWNADEVRAERNANAAAESAAAAVAAANEQEAAPSEAAAVTEEVAPATN
jgi:predicted  nucleic acid-binding Zn-ribbon protein